MELGRKQSVLVGTLWKRTVFGAELNKSIDSSSKSILWHLLESWKFAPISNCESYFNVLLPIPEESVFNGS